jgi:transposase InsO family protein
MPCRRIAHVRVRHGLATRVSSRIHEQRIADQIPGLIRIGIFQLRRKFRGTIKVICLGTRRWCGDITYLATWEGWLYLATVIDIASRRVAGFALADHLRTELVADALANAVAARDPLPRGDLPLRPGLHSTPRPRSPHSPATARSRCRWDARASAGTTPWPSRFRLAQRRADRHPGLADQDGGLPSGRGVHRVVQRHPAA